MIWRSFEDARKFAHSLKLTSKGQWEKYCQSNKLPNNITSRPDSLYKNNGWKSWGDWIGTGNIRNKDRQYKPFEEAREYARSLGLKNRDEWEQHCKYGKPDDIPRNPEEVYKNKGWMGVADWLDSGFISNREKSKNFLSPIEAKIEARKIAKELGIKTKKDWIDAYNAGKIPANLPYNPEQVYDPKYKKRIKFGGNK